MESITPYITYSIALAVAAIIPGPGIAAMIGRVLGRNATASIPFIIGLTVGDIFFLTLAVLGLSVIAQIFSGIFIVIKIMGGLYLIYLAYGLWSSKGKSIGIKQDVIGMDKAAFTAGFMHGLLVTLGNPKTIVFYMALLPNVINLADIGLAEWSVMAILTAVILMIVLTPYAIIASKAARILSSGKALKRLNRGAALVIGGAGVVIISDAIDSFYADMFDSPAVAKATN